VLLGGLVVVDDRDSPAGRQRAVEPIQELVRLLDLVIHVRQERQLDGLSGQSRVGRRAVHQRHAGDALARKPCRETVEVRLHDVLGIDRRARSQTLGESHRVVAVAGPDVGDPHSRLDAQTAQHALGLAVCVSRRLSRIGRRGDRRDRPIGRREPPRLRLRIAPRQGDPGREADEAPGDVRRASHRRMVAR